MSEDKDVDFLANMEEAMARIAQLPTKEMQQYVTQRATDVVYGLLSQAEIEVRRRPDDKHDN